MTYTLLFLMVNSLSSLNLPLYIRCSDCLTPLSALCCTRQWGGHTFPVLSCDSSVEDKALQIYLTRANYRRSITFLDLLATLCLMKPGGCWLALLQEHTADFCSPWCPPHPFLQSYFPHHGPQSMVMHGVNPLQVQEFTFPNFEI